MSANHYRFEVIDANGSCKSTMEMLASDMTAVLDKVTAISDGIAQPGCRIRVKDDNGNTVFVGVTIRQDADARNSDAA